MAWEPSVYDQAFATCNSYLSTEAPDLYSQVLSAYSTSAIPTAPCQLAGNVQAATTTDTLGTAAFDSHLSSVIAATPGLLSSAIDATPTGGFGGGQQSGMITGGNGNSLFPTPTGGAGPGVLLTPGTAAGSDAQTTAGGGGASQQTMNGGGQFGQGSNTAGGSSSQPTMPGTNDARTLVSVPFDRCWRGLSLTGYRKQIRACSLALLLPLLPSSGVCRLRGNASLRQSPLMRLRY